MWTLLNKMVSQLAYRKQLNPEELIGVRCACALRGSVRSFAPKSIKTNRTNVSYGVDASASTQISVAVVKWPWALRKYDWFKFQFCHYNFCLFCFQISINWEWKWMEALTTLRAISPMKHQIIIISSLLIIKVSKFTFIAPNKTTMNLQWMFQHG